MLGAQKKRPAEFKSAGLFCSPKTGRYKQSAPEISGSGGWHAIGAPAKISDAHEGWQQTRLPCSPETGIP